MKYLLICSAFLAAFAQEFSNNGVTGVLAVATNKVTVTVRPSRCDVEAVSVRIRFRASQSEPFRLAVKSAPVMRCQVEPVALVFRRLPGETPELIAIHELAVINNAKAGQ